MKLVTDDRCRIQSRELFKPNTLYQAERTADGRIQFVELVEKDVPLVKARKVNGKWMGAEVKIDRQAIVDAISADREAR